MRESIDKDDEFANVKRNKSGEFFYHLVLVAVGTEEGRNLIEMCCC